MRALLTLVVLITSAAACGSAPSAPATSPPSNRGGASSGAHEPMATIERTPCFGWCPVYKVTVFRDGTLEYDGDSYVKTKGKATGRLSADQLAKLDELFQANNYLALADRYTDANVTDMPSVNTSYTVGGKTKTVEHYQGNNSAPAGLSVVEEGIDRIIQIERWIGTEKEREELSHGGAVP
jgi:Domain of unknown function (DUF6438)